MQTRIEKYLFELDCQKCGKSHEITGSLFLELCPVDDEEMQWMEDNGHVEKNVHYVDGVPHTWQGLHLNNNEPLPFECTGCGHVEADIFKREHLGAVLVGPDCTLAGLNDD